MKHHPCTNPFGCQVRLLIELNRRQRLRGLIARRLLFFVAMTIAIAIMQHIDPRSLANIHLFALFDVD